MRRYGNIDIDDICTCNQAGDVFLPPLETRLPLLPYDTEAICDFIFFSNQYLSLSSLLPVLLQVTQQQHTKQNYK